MLWARLVDQVLAAGEPLDRAALRDWIRSETPAGAFADFVAGLPPTVDADGHPSAAEDVVEQGERGIVEAALAILLLGSRRIDELDGEALASFRGGANAPRRAYLDPNWIGVRARDYDGMQLQDFASGVVDDMLDQAHRIALRKLVVKPDGRIDMPSKLYEREGRYFADSAEGAYNIGYRAETLGTIATQLGLFAKDGAGLDVTDAGRQLLELP
jgi:hypothetical protein